MVFEAVHNPARPFQVITGSTEVVAMGTKFDVYLRAGPTLVAVVEDRVTVAAILLLGSTGGNKL